MMLKSIEDFQSRIECLDEAHDNAVKRTLARWRVTLSDDSREFDCTDCLQRRLTALPVFTPITVVRIRSVRH